jgi:hypothetical protein
MFFVDFMMTSLEISSVSNRPVLVPAAQDWIFVEIDD